MPNIAGDLDVQTEGKTEMASRVYACTRVRGHINSSDACLHGGYIDIRTVELCIAWTLLRQGVLRPVDVRVWLASLEVRERRKTLSSERSARYGARELHNLVGGGGGTLKGSLRRLRKTGLMTWGSAKGPVFAISPEQIDGLDLELFWSMARSMPSKRRRVPIPRRVLRMLAGGVNRSVLATTLGQLVWCLYYHRTAGWNPRGSCKGSWIAETFGLSERSIIRARAHLESLGWLRKVERPTWHMNRYGATYAVNLEWARTAGELSTTLARQKISTTKMSPLESQNGTRMSGPESDQTPLREEHLNQTPTLSGGAPPGISKKDQVLKEPNLRDIQAEDLSSMERLMKLFDQALAMQVVKGDSFMERLNFAALAEHCRVRGNSNPPGMFSRLLRWKWNPDKTPRAPSPAWHFVTEGDEEAVRLKLNAHMFDDPQLLESRPSMTEDELLETGTYLEVACE